MTYFLVPQCKTFVASSREYLEETVNEFLSKEIGLNKLESVQYSIA